MVLEYQKDGYSISTDQSKLEIDVIHEFLTSCYWAKNIPFDVVEKSVRNCLSYGVYKDDRMIGFARVLTDYATFAYLADVFILEEFRGRGLSKWLMECMLEHPELQKIRTWMLKTEDAHSLYEKYGFTAPDNPHKIMEKRVLKFYTAD